MEQNTDAAVLTTKFFNKVHLNKYNTSDIG